MNKSFFKIRSKVRTNIKYLYWRIFIPLNKFFKKKYIPENFFSIEFTNVCNLRCVFCGYQHFNGEFKINDLENFKHKIKEVSKQTKTNISFTPLTGDIFTDKNVIQKLKYVETFNGIEKYGLTTNFILCSKEEILEILNLKKLTQMKISIYGHDSDSFKKITKSNSYKRLLSNLKFLKQNANKVNFKINLAVRSYMDFNFNKFKESSELIKLIFEIEEKSSLIKKSQHYHYTNWGGTVTKKDIGNLDILLKDHSDAFKNGPCNRLYSFLITANNDVILCACRDTHRYMVIGNINENKLSNIVNPQNSKYKKWIDEQEKNIYCGPCKACDMYEPIYAKPLHQIIKKIGMSKLFKV